MADLAAGTIVEDFSRPTITRQLDMPPEFREPIIRGLTRVICPGYKTAKCGVTYPTEPVRRYRATTGESLFKDYPHEALPIAGKTGTAQGAGQYPWNDSSVFAGFTLSDERPYTAVAYLEKSGYGSKAAAPVVKCIFEALAVKQVPDPVRPSDPLDLTSRVAAEPMVLVDDDCLGGYDGSVRE
jgi:penicillin-binding protein 2